MPWEAGVRGSAGAAVSPVIPRPAVPEPPTLNPPSRVEQPAGARQQTPAPIPGRSPFDEFPVLRPGSGPISPPSTTAVATPPSVPKSGGGNDPKSEQHKTPQGPEWRGGKYPTGVECEGWG